MIIIAYFIRGDYAHDLAGSPRAPPTTKRTTYGYKGFLRGREEHLYADTSYALLVSGMEDIPAAYLK